MTARFRDLSKVHPCPIPDHAVFGRHLHEVQPGMWRLFETPKENQ